MPQSATIESLPAAFRIMKAMQVEGVEWGEDYRTAASAAMEDTLALCLANGEVALPDKLGAPFWLDLRSLIQPPAPLSLGARLDALLAAEGETANREIGRVTQAPGGAAALPDTPLGPTRLRLGLHRASGSHEWTGGHESLGRRMPVGLPTPDRPIGSRPASGNPV